MLILTNIQHTLTCLLCGVLLVLVGCQEGDDEAHWWDAPTTLALGSYYELTIIDGCVSQGGKIPANLCSTDAVVSIDIAVADDPTVIEVIPVSEAPEELGLPVDPATMAVHAIGEGKTTVTVSTTFDDGSQREIKHEVTVRKVAGLNSFDGCSNGAALANNKLQPTHLPTSFGIVALDDDGGKLAGALLNIVQSDSGEGGVFYGIGRVGQKMSFSLPAQEIAGTVTLSSTLVPDFSREIEFYGPGQVTRFEALPETWSSKRIATGQPRVLDVVTWVGGRLPCEGVALDITSLTPDICADGNQGPQWTARRNLVTLHAVKTGQCILELAPPGTDAVTTFTVNITVVTHEEIALRVIPRTPCSVERNVACSTSGLAILDCQEGIWQFPALNGKLQSCPNDTTCRYRDFDTASVRQVMAALNADSRFIRIQLRKDAHEHSSMFANLARVLVAAWVRYI